MTGPVSVWTVLNMQQEECVARSQHDCLFHMNEALFISCLLLPSVQSNASIDGESDGDGWLRKMPRKSQLYTLFSISVLLCYRSYECLLDTFLD